MLCANVTVEDIGVIKSCPYHVVPGCHRDARSPLEYFGHLLFGLLVVLILTIALPYSTPFLFLAKPTWFVRVKLKFQDQSASIKLCVVMQYYTSFSVEKAVLVAGVSVSRVQECLCRNLH